MASLLFFKYAINKKRIHLVTFIQHLEKDDGFPLLLKALLSCCRGDASPLSLINEYRSVVFHYFKFSYETGVQ